MPLYITISEGPTAGLSAPIVATADREVVRILGRVLARRLGVIPPTTPRQAAQRTTSPAKPEAA
jgi:hypothetical protein